MRKLPLDKVGKNKPSEPTIEVRFINEDGNTEVWLMGSGLWKSLDDVRSLELKVAYIDNGVDIRIGRQLESINRLLKHLDMHHEQLGISPLDRCAWKEDEDADK